MKSDSRTVATCGAFSDRGRTIALVLKALRVRQQFFAGPFAERSVRELSVVCLAQGSPLPLGKGEATLATRAKPTTDNSLTYEARIDGELELTEAPFLDKR